MKDGQEKDEYIITRHSQFNPPINIVNIYGEQESRSQNKDIEERWQRIQTELLKIEYKGENVILIGDQNKHVGDIVDGNNEKVSFGGKLIREFLKNQKYALLNSLNKVRGGHFTRYNPAAPNEKESKACLELIIISKALLKYVDEVSNYKDLKFTPGRPITKTKMCYPDHYDILITMKNIPSCGGWSPAMEKCKIWNLNKEGGQRSIKN